MKSSDIRITTDGKIMYRNECIGFTEDDKVYVFSGGRSRPIGSFDHKSEIIAMVIDDARR